MKNLNKKIPKLKKGAWFVRVRGSYLPMTPQAWLLHCAMVGSVFAVISAAYSDTRSIALVILSTTLEIIGIGTIFTYIAAKKA